MRKVTLPPEEFYIKDGDKYVRYYVDVEGNNHYAEYVSANAAKHVIFDAYDYLGLSEMLAAESFDQLSGYLYSLFADDEMMSLQSVFTDFTKGSNGVYCLSISFSYGILDASFDTVSASAQIVITFTDTAILSVSQTSNSTVTISTPDIAYGGSGSGSVSIITAGTNSILLSFSNTFDATKMKTNYKETCTDIENAGVQYSLYINGYDYGGGSFDFAAGLVLADNTRLAGFEWYLDEDCTQKAPAKVTVGESYETVTLYANVTAAPEGKVMVIEEGPYGTQSISFRTVGEIITPSSSFYSETFVTIDDGEEFKLTGSLTLEAGKIYKFRYAD